MPESKKELSIMDGPTLIIEMHYIDFRIAFNIYFIFI